MLSGGLGFVELGVLREEEEGNARKKEKIMKKKNKIKFNPCFQWSKPDVTAYMHYIFLTQTLRANVKLLSAYVFNFFFERLDM